MSEYKWVVTVGEMFHAVDLYGMFDHYELAEEWARANATQRWGVYAVKIVGEN